MTFSLHQLTALHMAAERGYIEIVEYLVGKQADIDIQDSEDKVICDYSTDQYCIAHLSLNQQRMQVYRYGRRSATSVTVRCIEQ